MTVAAKNPLVKAVALAAGGDLPEEAPFDSIVRTFADPRRAVRAVDAVAEWLTAHLGHDAVLDRAHSRLA